MRIGVGSGLAAMGLAFAGPAMAGDPAPVGGVRLVQPITFPVIPEFRVRVVLPPSEPNWRMQGPQSLSRHGIGGALFDFYPFDDHLHLSAGGRLYNRGGGRSADPASLQILSGRMPGGGRQGRGFTPTVLVGYSIERARGMALGFDAGVMVGRSSPGPDVRWRNDEGPRTPEGMNGLARVTLRRPF